jgi:DNA primase
LSKSEFLNFNEISKAISFEDVLNWLNIPFQRKDKELRGEGFIINIDKNLFFCPDNDEQKGSVINFVAHYKKVDLRESAMLLKAEFLSKKTEAKPKRDIPNLTLEWHPYIQERGISEEVFKEYELGYVKQRSIVAGRIALKVYDHEGKHIGYIGYRESDGNWYFPKGFKRPLYNAFKVKDTKSVIVTVDPFDALKIASLGFKQVVSLLANSMTTEQEEQLKKFRYILLFHPKPENIVYRLYPTSFIHALVLSKPIKEISEQELVKIIKPS